MTRRPIVTLESLNRRPLLERVEVDPRSIPARSKGPTMLNAIRQFFAPVRGASAALLNPEELFRSILTALGSGSFLGILLTVLQAVLANAAAIFPNPLASALATMVLTLVGDLLRRINHVGPAPVPPIA